jgi:biotin carboxyl carrier protein
MPVEEGTVVRATATALDVTVAVEFEEGESVRVLERLVIAPCRGVFEPHAPATVTTEGEIVTEGQAVGVVSASGDEVPVRSAFSGFMMGLLAHPGERVREGQPVAWLRTFDR